MKNVSSAFREELKKDNRNYIKSADITLKNGTVLEIDNSDLWQNGMKLDTATSSSNSFDLGAIITGQLTLTLNNIDEKFSDYDFTDCTATNVKVGLKLPDGTTESLSYGKFYLNEAKYNGSIITLTFYDSIYKFDQPYSKSSLSYPATLRQIVQDACSVCGVTQGTFTFDQDDFVVQERPDDSSITFRQVLQWVGQISCQYFYADVQGRLRMAWYDVGLLDSLVTDVEEGFLQDTAGEYVLDHNSEKINTLKLLSEPDDDVEESPYDDTMFHEIESFTSLTTGLDDVVITGIRIIQEVDSEDGGKENITIQYGTDGYVLGIEGNKFITEENASDVAAMVGIKTIGMQFRSFSANALSDPTIEPGDVVLLIDRKKKRYKSIVTNNTFHPGNFQAFSCGAKSPIRNSSTRFSQITQVYTDYRKELSQQRTDIETALAELDDRIENSSGLFTTIEEQPDGSKKYFLHDKPLLSDSEIVWSMTAEAWGVSTDGGKTQNAGMTVDGDTIVRILTAVGINADWINTGALTIEKNGQVMFKADVDTGQVDIVANSFSLRGQTIDEIAQGEVNEFVNGVYAPTLNEIQNQIDQKTETWYQPTDPSLKWTETEESALQDTAGADILDTNGEQIIGILEIGKTVHEGDLWKNSDTNVEYIYQDGQWIEMPIPDAVFDEIDGKARIFVTTPVPPYSERDLWMQGPDGDIMTCVHGRESGSFVSSDWEVKQKYTDDTAVGELDLALDKQGVFDRLTNYGEVKGIFLESDGQLYINASYLMTGILKVAQPGASGKETFYANMDTGEVRIVANSFSLTNGDTIDSIAQGAVDDLDDSLTQTDIFNRLTGNKANEAIILQNGHIYINASYLNTGILQVSTASGTETLYVNVDTGEVRINATSFSLTDGRTIDSIADDAKDEAIQYTDERLADYDPTDDLTQQEVFNILTNGGTTQGIYLQGGRIYINASYIGSGTLDADRINAKGLSVYNTSGTRTLYIDNNGNVSINANSLMLSGTSVNSIANNAANSALQDAKDYTDLQIENFDPDLTQQEVFNILTNGGTTQGIYLSGGKIYINAAYIGSGIISASRIASSSISAGLITADKISISDLRSLSATIGGITIGSQGLSTSNGLLRFYNDGRIVFNNSVTLEAEGNGMSIRTGLTIYSSSGGDFGDGTGLINFRGIGSTTGGTYLVAQGNLNSIAKRSSSSKRYKDHIRDLDDEEALSILDIPVVVFKYKDGYLVKGDLLEGKPIPGFYAEDVEEVAPILCQYNLDGSVEDWNYRTMIPYMLKTMQIQQKQIDNLQTQINELKTIILNMKGA